MSAVMVSVVMASSEMLEPLGALLRVPMAKASKVEVMAEGRASALVVTPLVEYLTASALS